MISQGGHALTLREVEGITGFSAYVVTEGALPLIKTYTEGNGIQILVIQKYNSLLLQCWTNLVLIILK